MGSHALKTTKQKTTVKNNIDAAFESLALADSFFKEAGQELSATWTSDSTQWAKVLTGHNISRPVATHSLQLAGGHIQTFEDIEKLRVKASATIKFFKAKADKVVKGVPRLTRALAAYDSLSPNQRELFAVAYAAGQRPARTARRAARSVPANDNTQAAIAA